LRVRVSTGLKVAEYFGNFFMKNATDVELAGIDSLKAIGVTLAHDGKLVDGKDVYIQSALLYTTSRGERRVRVHNLSLSVAAQLSNVFKNAEMDTTVNLLARMTVQKAYRRPLVAVRDELTVRCTKILLSYRQHCAASSSPGQLILPESLKLLPLYTLSLMKSRAFRGGKLVPSDLRVHTMRLINSLGIGETVNYLYPCLYDVSSFNRSVMLPNEHGIMTLPTILRVSAERMRPDGVYIAGIFNHLYRKWTSHVPLDWTTDLRDITSVFVWCFTPCVVRFDQAYAFAFWRT
jgi:protein transport protein SEC24